MTPKFSLDGPDSSIGVLNHSTGAGEYFAYMVTSIRPARLLIGIR